MKNCEEHKMYITEGKMQNLVSKNLESITIDKELLELSLDLYKAELLKNSKKTISQKELLQEEFLKLNKKISRLIDLRIGGNIQEEAFKEKHDKLQKEKVDLEIAISNVKEENIDLTFELLEKYKKRSYEMVKMFENGDFSVRKELMDSALLNFTVKNQKVASIQYKLPYALNLKVGKNPDLETLLPIRDSNPNKRIQNPLSYH